MYNVSFSGVHGGARIVVL